MIYFVLSHSLAAIKIGYTKHSDCSHRLRSFRTSNPDQLTLLGVNTRDGLRRDEERIHSTYKALNIRGEWFRADVEIVVNEIILNRYVTVTREGFDALVATVPGLLRAVEAEAMARGLSCQTVWHYRRLAEGQEGETE